MAKRVGGFSEAVPAQDMHAAIACAGCGEELRGCSIVDRPVFAFDGELDSIELWHAGCAMVYQQTGFTQSELRTAFEIVQNRSHWKGPIDALVFPDLREVVAAAVVHFTGTSATFARSSANPSALRVTAPGYWAGPCN